MCHNISCIESTTYYSQLVEVKLEAALSCQLSLGINSSNKKLSCSMSHLFPGPSCPMTNQCKGIKTQSLQCNSGQIWWDFPTWIKAFVGFAALAIPYLYPILLPFFLFHRYYSQEDPLIKDCILICILETISDKIQSAKRSLYHENILHYLYTC